MNQVKQNEAMRRAAANYDNAIPPEPEGMDMEPLMDALLSDASSWLADAVCEAVCNNDLALLIKQVERHVPGWTRP